MKLFLLKKLPDHSVYDQTDSPLGPLTIIASNNGLHAVLGENEWESNIINLSRDKNHDVINNTKNQLHEYFQNKRKIFDLPISVNGTDFQLKTWEVLRTIPYAKTISYGEQAAQLGDKKKARAVGMANGLNPIAIIIPCHRVIGANGKLIGFRGGVERKKFLLDFEMQSSLC